MGNYAVNPQCKAASSTAVTPIQTFLPVLKDVAWAAGVFAVIMGLLDEDEYKVRFKQTIQTVSTTVDMNDYLPTTVGGYGLRIARNS